MKKFIFIVIVVCAISVTSFAQMISLASPTITVENTMTSSTGCTYTIYVTNSYTTSGKFGKSVIFTQSQTIPYGSAVTFHPSILLGSKFNSFNEIDIVCSNGLRWNNVNLNC